MSSIIEKVCLIFNPRCEQVQQLTSEGLDRPLRWHESLALRIHRCMCWSCRHFKRQLTFLQETMGLYSKRQAEDVKDAQLSDECKDRLKKLGS